MAVRDVVQAAAGVGGGGEYIEDLFSTYLYTGNGSTQTITNGIDLDGEGGLVWVKNRTGANNHILTDSARGTANFLRSNLTNAQDTNSPNLISAFNSNGFSLGVNYADVNASSNNYASWTWRKSPKFFDVVTWTGNGVAGRTVAHDLGSVPGCIIVKQTDISNNWAVYHRGIGATKNIYLNATDGAGASNFWNSTTPTETNLTVGSSDVVNGNGNTYVAYLFAHDAGGFGDDGEQNVISCGSYTGNGSTTGPVIDLGYEPQFLMFKRATGGTANWMMVDNMRGLNVTGRSELIPNLTNAEYNNATSTIVEPTSTGFKLTANASQTNAASSDYIYIAIRRPMKTPESGTEVFAVDQFTAGQTAPSFISDFPVDMAWLRNTPIADTFLATRLLGAGVFKTNTTSAWGASGTFDFDYSDGWNSSTRDSAYYSWMFRRAPSVFDVVCWTGDGTQNRGIAHNLTTTPELIITKTRNSGSFSWFTYTAPTGLGGSLFVNNDSELNTGAGANAWGSTAFNESNFYISGPTAGYSGINGSGTTYIAYLFATLAGVSKVGSYTGTGADLNVDCGFSAGARFILIKRTDSTGDWYYWDSVRGISAGNDPYMLLNNTAAENTSTDYIDPLSSGFTVTSSAPAALNASGGSYIFLAIA